MADINVFESIDVTDFSQQTTYLVDVDESVTVTDGIGFEERLAYLPEKVLLPIRESLIFNTLIKQSHDRTEQRTALRIGYPDRRFMIKVIIETDSEISKFENKLHGKLKESWAFPLWPLAESHATTITAGDTSITVDTTNTGFTADGYVMIWQDIDTYDILRIASVTPTTLYLKTTPVNTYSSSKMIMPCVASVCTGTSTEGWSYGSAAVGMNFRVKRVKDVIDYSPDMTYDGKVVLKDPPINKSRTANYTFNPDFTMLDAGTGLFDIVSNSDFNIVTQPYTWHCDTKAEAWELRQLFHYINGQQKGVLVPTFRNDLKLTQDVGAGDTTVYVENTGIADNLGLNDMRTYLAFRPTGSDIIVRKITGITEIDSTEEALTIDASPGDTFSTNDYLSWVDLCRLSNNQVNFDWYLRGECFVEVGLTRIMNYTDPIVEVRVDDDLSVSASAEAEYELGISRNDSITIQEDETVTIV